MVVTSPSFSLVNEYEGRCVLFHIDAYRLESLSDFMSAGLEEYLYMEGVVAMEWSERCAEILPEWSLKVDIGIKAENERELVFSGEHERAAELIKALEIEEIETN